MHSTGAFRIWSAVPEAAAVHRHIPPEEALPQGAKMGKSRTVFRKTQNVYM